MYQELTFDQLPKAVTMLTNEVSELKRLLLEKQAEPSTQPNDKPLSISEAAEFLNLSVPTLYSKVSRGQLPVMKRGKRLYFSLPELKDYLKAGRKKSNAEIEAEADQYLIKSKKG
ncbi:MAG: helix-turn-helix domain-containing protein [Algoriphagus sp.]|uniref:helix-turn-helix domain-containing protein n=1 Tax=Algoriphagus sp. TaxID=1872435 RepID=UPI00261DF0EE|nr:helix-turn-helix domain-containing protein [Algoriphagus sp.]MDG1276088.1 helix-turn-helix domain-containing protein [Algoriphagus sp.]